MKRGLVIGKFMPVHEGHMALIRFASTRCDELIVSMSYTGLDPIPFHLRFSWLKEITNDDSKIKPELIKDDFDDESLPWPERIKIWACFLEKCYGVVHVIVSSEEYGPMLAAHMGVAHITFDSKRTRVSVSASMIRQQPFSNWKFIPPIARPYFVKKICLYGPESTGKSMMSRYLAELFQTEYVPEVAREIINSNDFTTDDIIKIGQAQTERILEKAKTANKILFCDTDLITTQIYCRYYLGEVPPMLQELEKQITYDQYFLFDIDVPWVADGLRDLSNSRQSMFDLFKSELEIRHIPYLLVKGDYEEREQFMRGEIEKMIHD